MNEHISKLIERLRSNSAHDRGNSAGLLGLVLEMNTIGRADQRYYKDYVPSHLLSISLDRAGQAEIVSALVEAVPSSNDEGKASMLWSIGKAEPIISAVPLLTLIRDDFLNWNADESFQALHSLLDMLYGVEEDSSSGPIRKALEETDPTPFVQRALTLPDPRLPEFASEIMKRIDKILRFETDNAKASTMCVTKLEQRNEVKKDMIDLPKFYHLCPTIDLYYSLEQSTLVICVRRWTSDGKPMTEDGVILCDRADWIFQLPIEAETLGKAIKKGLDASRQFGKKIHSLAIPVEEAVGVAVHNAFSDVFVSLGVWTHRDETTPYVICASSFNKVLVPKNSSNSLLGSELLDLIE